MMKDIGDSTFAFPSGPPKRLRDCTTGELLDVIRHLQSDIEVAHASADKFSGILALRHLRDNKRNPC